MILKAFLIGCVAALTALEGGWLGECKLREPLVTGFLVGLILGNVKQGIIIGGQLQLVWMGATGIGLAPGLAIGTGGTIGAAFAIITNSGLETAIAFGLPASILMQSVNSLRCTLYSTFMHKADSYAKEANTKGMIRVHYLAGLITAIVNIVPVFLTVYYGVELVQKIVDNLPSWVNAGLGGISAIIPCLGFAMLMQILMEQRLIPFFVIGYILAAYLKLDMMAITGLAAAVAIIVYLNGNKKSPVSEEETL